MAFGSMSSPAPFHSIPSGSQSERVRGHKAPAGGEGAAYELYNLGTELRKAANRMEGCSYLVLRLPTEESWAFAQPEKNQLTEAPPPYPLWIPRREVVVDLAKNLG